MKSFNCISSSIKKVTADKDLVIKKLAEANLVKETLRLSARALTDDHIIEICKLLTKHDYGVTVLDISERATLSNKICAAIANLLMINTSITDLDLSFNDLSLKAATLIATGLSLNKTLLSLRMSNGNLEQKICSAIIEANIKRPLRILVLANNKIGLSGIKLITTLFENNRNLVHLDLSSANVNDKGAELLAEALKGNINLLRLDLRWNFIGERAVIALVAVLKENDRLCCVNSK